MYELPQSMIHDIPIDELNKLGTYTNKACKISSTYDSDLYSRNGYGSNYEIDKIDEPVDSFSNVPSFMEDSLDLGKMYINRMTNVGKLTGYTVKQESAFDVNKKYKITDGENTFYSPIDSPIFYKGGGEDILYVYRPVEYEDESDSTNIMTRFFNDGSIIIKGSSIKIEELPTVELYL